MLHQNSLTQGKLHWLFGGPTRRLSPWARAVRHDMSGARRLDIIAAYFAPSLGMLRRMAKVARRGEVRLRRRFSVLAAVLTVLVLVILASSFLRLTMYEEAFGFTRIRTYVHVFMGWLALLLVAQLVLEFRSRLRYFAAALLVAAVGFALTLQLINVDGLIARQNIARAATGESVDGDYLANVSLDAVPALVEAARAATPAMRERINGQLACHAEALSQDRAWQSTTLSVLRARSALGDYDLAGARCSSSY
jgi:hypothetical protein